MKRNVVNAIGLAAGLTVLTSPANAYVSFSFSSGYAYPTYSYYYPVYAYPPPVFYAPPPVVYRPVYHPPPVFYPPPAFGYSFYYSSGPFMPFGFY